MRSPFRVPLLLALALTYSEVQQADAQNQTFYLFAPKPVVPVSQPLGTPPDAIVHSHGDENQLILPDLKALVLIGLPSDVVKLNGNFAPGIQLKDLDAPSAGKLKKTLSQFLGKKCYRKDLTKLITDIIVHYRIHDHPVVDVIVPEQEITGGAIQILVLEATVGEVKVTGLRWFPDKEIRTDFRVKPGDKIIGDDIKGDLQWANQNPFHTTDVVYQPGAATGQTNIELHTVDRFPARFYTGYENTGNSSTGYDRYLAGFNWGDAFGANDGIELNYQYTTSGNLNSLGAHSASTEIPLPWHHTLTLFGSYVATNAHIPGDGSINGVYYQSSIRYSMPLPYFGDFKESLSTGFDYKYSKDSLIFNDTQVSGEPIEVAQFAATYDATYRDNWGITSAEIQGYHSPGGLTTYNYDDNFYKSHTFATADYDYGTFQLTRVNRLPANFSIFFRGEWQLSNRNLTPSEQLGAGGYDTVRGYDQREVNADEGAIYNAEIHSPAVSFGHLGDCADFNDQLQFVTFFDYGSLNNYRPLPGERASTELESYGVGLRYSINTNVSVRYDYGIQLKSTGLDNDHGGREDLGIVFSY